MLQTFFFVVITVSATSCKSSHSNLATQDSLHGDQAVSEKTQSHFKCKKLAKGYRPYYLRWDEGEGVYVDYSKKNKGLLGAAAMRSEDECQKALENANHEFGVICSATGLGWKPTLYTGTTPGRADYGYLGGSSMDDFDDCLMAVRNSSAKGVCFYGGLGPYYIARIDRADTISRPFKRLADCIEQTKPEVER